MKLLFSAFLNVCFLSFYTVSYAHTGCNYIDKTRLAGVMNISPELRPFLALEIPNCSNISLGEDYANFILNIENEKINDGIRTEISINYPFVEGNTVGYNWTILLPDNSAPGGNADQWWVLAQWHDQPDPRYGETWATHKPQSPPVAVYVEKRNGVVGIGLQGMKGAKLTWIPTPTNTWLNLRMLIHWSTSNDGQVQFSVAGHPEFYAVSNGPNMLNHYQHYFKVGQYRAPTVSHFTEFYVKDISFRKISK